MTTFTDIESAYEHNVNPFLVNWVDNMLRQRAVNMQNGIVKTKGIVSRGYGHASVETGAVRYAEDISVVVRGKFTDTIFDIIMKKVLQRLRNSASNMA